MFYDKHDENLDKVIITLFENKKSFLLNDLNKLLPEFQRHELKGYLESLEMDLVSIDLDCKKGGSCEDLYFLNLAGNRLIESSNSWIGWIMKSYKRPMKVYNIRQAWTKAMKKTYASIITIIAFISMSINYFQYRSSENANLDREKVKTQSLIIDSISRANDSLINMIKSKDTSKTKAQKPSK